MIEVTVDSIRVSLMSENRVVMLKEIGAERYLPIWIGLYEAEALAIRLQNRQIARPLTHDLLHNIIAEMGGEVIQIAVNDMRDDTYYARITVKLNGRRFEIDARPSDAINLAVRADAPIFVDEDVMAQAAITPEADLSEEAESEDLSPFREFVNKLDLGDLPVQ